MIGSWSAMISNWVLCTERDFWFCMQKNQWVTIGHQLSKESLIEWKDYRYSFQSLYAVWCDIRRHQIFSFLRLISATDKFQKNLVLQAYCSSLPSLSTLNKLPYSSVLSLWFLNFTIQSVGLNCELAVATYLHKFRWEWTLLRWHSQFERLGAQLKPIRTVFGVWLLLSQDLTIISKFNFVAFWCYGNVLQCTVLPKSNMKRIRDRVVVKSLSEWMAKLMWLRIFIYFSSF